MSEDSEENIPNYQFSEDDSTVDKGHVADDVPSGGGFSAFINGIVQQGCCFTKWGAGPDHPASRLGANDPFTNIINTGYPSSEESSSDIEPTQNVKETAKARNLARECGLEWSGIPTSPTFESQAASWYTTIPLTWALENGFTELNAQQKSLVALYWIRNTTDGQRTSKDALKQLITSGRELHKKANVEQTVKSDTQFTRLSCESPAEYTDLEGVGGEYHRLVEQFNNGSLYLIIQRSRVVATTIKSQGELFQHIVFDLGITQQRGPGVFCYDNYKDAESLIFYLFTNDTGSRHSKIPYHISRVKCVVGLLPPPPLKEDSLQDLEEEEGPAIVSAVSSDEQEEDPHRDFKAMYGAMQQAGEEDDSDEAHFAMDPTGRMAISRRREK